MNSQQFKSHLTIWLLPLIYYSFICYLSSLSNPPHIFPDWPMQDKVSHVMAYFVLGFLMTRSVILEYRLNPSAKLKLKILLAFLLLLVGAIDEFHQSFVPDRMVEFADWVADVIGGAMGALVARYLYREYKSVDPLIKQEVL